MSAVIYDMAAERTKREARALRGGTDHRSRVFQNLERGGDLTHVGDEMLIRWATMLSDAGNGGKTLQQVCDEVGAEIEKAKAETHAG